MIENGTKNGYGRIVYSKETGSVSVFMGKFKDGAINGIGTYTYQNGTKVFGDWTNGKLTESVSDPIFVGITPIPNDQMLIRQCPSRTEMILQKMYDQPPSDPDVLS